MTCKQTNTDENGTVFTKTNCRSVACTACNMRQSVMTCKKTNTDENGTVFMKTNCSYLFGWLEIMTNIKISPKW